MKLTNDDALKLVGILYDRAKDLVLEEAIDMLYDSEYIEIDAKPNTQDVKLINQIIEEVLSRFYHPNIDRSNDFVNYVH